MIRIILYLILLALMHAKMELMIEGNKGGWALNLPCWRISNWLINLLINKELTGYHFYMCLLFLFIFHSPFLFIPFTLKKEMIVIGSYFLYFVVEDYFWFLENSIYGARNFKKGRIYWHKRWLWRLPVSYIWSIVIGILLLFLGRK